MNFTIRYLKSLPVARVWVFEFGKFDLKSQFNKGPQGIQDLKKYMYRNTLIMLDVAHRQSERNKGPSINGIARRP
ncbi:unnamed protein product [Allacma fusca]|uniref:Uncharacterized protein n=1 Tax=Allacma fusca TaxID=39272 RepID=A0A8J2LTG1_9HEXA|nr:unnamed protein product [Allacma fusca]